MNLLLLLSALLSALTGVGASVRAPDVAQAVTGTSIARATPAAARARAAARPACALPSLATAGLGPIGALAMEARVVALWMDRRRE